MNALLRPGLGFAAPARADRQAAGDVDDEPAGKVSRAGAEAARRTFTPEFVNRIDKIVVFRLLSRVELRKILALELSILQERNGSSRRLAAPSFPFPSAVRRRSSCCERART